MPQAYPKTRWHRILGKMLEEWLIPVNITVNLEFPLSNDPPEADILLIRNTKNQWNQTQKERLPDGIRQTHASHILIEFKYSQSTNTDAFFQIISYYSFYQRAKKISKRQLRAFVVSSKTPNAQTLRDFGYATTDHAGVYQSKNVFLAAIDLIVLNELENTAYNAPLKCFASRKKEQRKAFEIIEHGQIQKTSKTLGWLLEGLAQRLLLQKGRNMSDREELTPDELIEEGKKWEKFVLAHTSIEERLAGVPPEEVLKNYAPEEVLKNYAPEEVLKNYSLKDIQRYLDTLKQKKP